MLFSNPIERKAQKRNIKENEPSAHENPSDAQVSGREREMEKGSDICLIDQDAPGTRMQIMAGQKFHSARHRCVALDGKLFFPARQRRRQRPRRNHQQVPPPPPASRVVSIIPQLNGQSDGLIQSSFILISRPSFSIATMMAINANL